MSNQRRHLSEEDKQFIRDNYKTMLITEICKKIGFAKSTIRSFRLKEGLTLTEAEKQKRMQKSFFKKGHKPFNTGMKQHEFLTPEQIERTAKTRFKKGQFPHNTREMFEERITKDGYVEIKVHNRRPFLTGESNFVLKQRWVWEQINGEIPENHVITFKDGNKQNCSIENLEMKSREQLMLENTFHNLPEEIKVNRYLQNSINRIIKNHERNTI